MPSFICCLHAAHAGNIQKAQPSAFRNSIKFLSLCSRLFLCNPIVMHWSWNQSPAVHGASGWFQTVRTEDSLNSSINNPINKRGEYEEKPRAPIQQKGCVGNWAYRSRLRAPQRGHISEDYRADRKSLFGHKTVIFTQIEDSTFLWWDFRTTDSSTGCVVFRECACWGLWTAPACTHTKALSELLEVILYLKVV